MDKYFAGCIFLFILSVYFLLGSLAPRALNDCGKKHNVYECELVAVPKEAKNG